MQFSVISTLAFAAAVVAQSTQISFTVFPMTVQAGKPITLTYKADNLNQPARIVLRKGASTDLKDVATVADSATGGSYTWTPSTSLQNGNDYALEIIQGDQFNYGGQFSLTGGSDTAPSSSSSSSSMMSSSSSASSYSMSKLSTMMPIPLSTGSMTRSYGTGNSTAAAASGTAPMVTAPMATGTGSPVMPSNGTFSQAPLSPSTTGGSTAGATGGSASTGSAGSAPAATTSAKSASGAGHLGSSFALVAGAVAAFVFLN